MSVAMRPRRRLSYDAWSRMAGEASPPLLALWADSREIYALLRDCDSPLLVSMELDGSGYPALSPARPTALWFERTVHDLWGHRAIGATDARSWLDHGRWPRNTPMTVNTGQVGPAEPPEFLLPEALDQIPLGPVRGGLEPAAHLRLAVEGETIRRAEVRLGYTHKGTLSLMRGKSPRAAARFAARLAAAATVAHGTAFARASEAALGVEVPPRASALRGLMAEIERILCHLDALSAIAEAAGLEVLATSSAWQAELQRAAADVAFGHRLMMDCIVPGGVAGEITPSGGEAIGQALSALVAELPSLQGLTRAMRQQISGHGVAGEGAVMRAGERLAAIGDAIGLARARLGALPEGALSIALPVGSGEGIGFAKAPGGGEIWHWLRLDHGQIVSLFMCDPAWQQWAELEAVMAGAQLGELSLILASFGLSTSGADL
jgi:Ni,Fe-hydrogenase III large subunit